MGYATAADLEARLGTAAYVQLTDDENTGSASGGRVEEALLAAQGEIDSRLGCRYAVPVDVSSEAEAGALLRALTLDLAAHRLHSRRPAVPEEVGAAAERVREWLRDVLTGRAVLPVSKAAAEGEVGGIVAEVSGPARVFSGKGRDEC